MGQVPNQLTPDASPLHRWGFELRALRLARGLSLRKLAADALVDHSHLGRWERAERVPSDDQVQRLDSVLSAGGALVRRWVDVANPAIHVASTSPGLAATSQSGAASAEGIFVPTRLQDGSVAFVALDRRSMLRTIGAGAAAALGVTSQEAAAREARLLRAAAGAAGATPLEHLQRKRRVLIESDNVLGPRQVIQTAHGHIEVIKALRADATGTDRRELMDLQTQYAELIGWFYQDLGALEQAGRWLNRALAWSHGVGDSDLTAYIMARQAQLAADSGDGDDVVDLAEAAAGLAAPRSRLAAVALTYGAVGHAMRGDARGSQQAIDSVRAQLDGTVSDPSPWGVWLDQSYVAVHHAQSQSLLGEHARAAAAFDAALAGLPAGYHRDRGVYLARSATARAAGASPEQAAAVGLQALAIAADTGSGRIIRELVSVDQALIPAQRDPAVAAFREAFASLVHDGSTIS